MTDSSFCSFAFDLRLYCFLDFFLSFVHMNLSPLLFSSPFSFVLGLCFIWSLWFSLVEFHLMFVLCYTGSHIAVCFHPFSQTAEPSSTVIIFLILNGFSLLPSIPPWSLFSIFLPPVSQYSKPSSTAVIFSFPLGLATFFLCSSSLFLLHSIGKSTFLSTFWPSISKYSELSSITIIFSFPLGLSNFSPCSSCLLFSNSIEKSNLSSTFWLSFSSFSMLTMFSWLKTWIYLGVNTIISPISEPSSSFLVTLPSSLSFFFGSSPYAVFLFCFFWGFFE